MTEAAAQAQAIALLKQCLQEAAADVVRLSEENQKLKQALKTLPYTFDDFGCPIIFRSEILKLLNQP